MQNKCKMQNEVNVGGQVVLYNILSPINGYIGNSTTKCHCRSMSDNRDLTETFTSENFFTSEGYCISF